MQEPEFSPDDTMPMEPIEPMEPLNPTDAAMPMEPERRSNKSENLYKRSIFDVPVTVNISVGRKKLSVAELLELRPETVIALGATIEDPVDLTIHDRVIARGELIETEEGTLAVRLTEIEEQSNG